MKKNLKNNQGFTLVELMVSLFVISIIMISMFSLIIYSLKITKDNASYVEAIQIANQKIEFIRNLPYSDVGTASGSPSGIIPDYEVEHRNSTYTIHTTIMFHDDEFDGTLASGTDTIFVDYKIATINVSWNNGSDTKNVVFFSKIIPSTEETLSGYGLLKIIVVDANGNPVPNANIHIENTLHSLDVNIPSDINGMLSYAVLPDFEGYKITVTKAGYGTDKTYDRDAVNLNPTKPHLSVYEGVKTEESFSIDLLSHLIINSVIGALPNNWQVNTDTSGQNQTNSRIAIDPSGYIYIFWQDYRQSSKPKVYAQKYSKDGDAQWPNTSSPDDIVVANSNNTIVPDILVDTRGNLFATWHDDSTGDKAAYIVSLNSSDGSDRWGAEKKINTASDNKDQAYPRLTLTESATNSSTTVVWQDSRNSNWDIFAMKFRDNGDMDWSSEVRVNSNPTSDGKIQYDPVITSDDLDNVYIAWSDNRNSNLDVYAQKLDKSGTKLWGASDLKANTNVDTSNQYEADIAINSLSDIFIIWTDDRNGNKDIYMHKYASSGTSVWGDTKINTNSDSSNQYSPSIAIDNADIIYIVWTDDRNGNKDIYAQKYDSSGTALWVDDLRVNMNNDTSNQYNPDIIISPYNNTPYASWDGDRNGDTDIFLSSFDFYGTSTTVPNIPVTVTSSKRIGENPIIYKYNEIHNTGASAAINLEVEWDPAYSIGIVSASTTYTLLLSYPSSPTQLLPNTTKNIYLYLD